MARNGSWLYFILGLAACTEPVSPPKTEPKPDTTAPSLGLSISFSSIRATSLVVSWGTAADTVTSPGNLKYKIVKAASAASIDTLVEADAIITGSGLIQDFAAGLTSKAVMGLTSSTSYAFAVVVRDEAGNKALYAPATVATLDLSAPSVGEVISFSELAPSSLTVNWGMATDDVTPATQLRYKLVKAAGVTAIDTLAEVGLITSGPDLVQDFTPNLTSQAVSGLSTSTTIAFAVAVKDAAGNQALYSPATVTTLDVTPPTVGSSISLSHITADAVTVSWGTAIDAVTPTANLKYKLVKASDPAEIDTLEELDAIVDGDKLVHDFTENLTTHNVTGLLSSTSYAFAVVVKDEAGNQAPYAPATVSTLDASAPTIGAPISFSNVTPTSLTLSWGAASDDRTPPSELRYKVVKAAGAVAIDTLAEVAAITSGSGVVQDFTAALTGKVVSGLTSSSSYAFAVVVEDAVGNQALYSPATQATLDITAPSVGTGISFANITANSLTVNWGKATDDVSSVVSLQYKVVKAAQSALIDTVPEVDAITSGPDLVQDFATDLAVKAVSGLTSSTSYAFAVLVRDSSGNKSLYTPATVSTLDISAPMVGTALSFSNLAATSLTVNWGAATDNVTPQALLQYKVVRALNLPEVDTLAEVDAITSGSGLVQNYTANLTTQAVTGLTSSTPYAFAVVVRDIAGNRALYNPAVQSTLDASTPSVGTGINFTSITATSLTVNWGAATDDVTSAVNLQYKVVRAATVTEIDSVAEVFAITSGPGLVQDYTANLTTRPVTGLASSTSYAFAVVVRDAAGNQALYPPQLVSTLDISAPTPGLALNFTNVTDTSLTLNWGAATDDLTLPANLEYKVVRAASVNEIDSLAEVNLITAGPALIQDFTANLTTRAVTGLTASTSYAFAVVVRDAAGNQALYAPASQSTLDTTPPTLGSAIRFSAVSTSSITVNWGVASDNATPAVGLQYKLVRAVASTTINSVAAADAVTGPDLLLDWTTNVLTTAVGGLSAGDFRYYAVLVRDAAGNRSLYSPLARVAGRVFYESTAAHSANLGGPAGADALCVSLRDARAATDVSAKAVLASGATRRACTTANCISPAENVNWPLLPSTTYYNLSGGVVGTTNTAGIFSFPLTSPMVPLTTSYSYSGLSNDWTSTATHCAGYTDTNAAGSVYLGLPSDTTVGSISAVAVPCSSTVSSIQVRLLCVEP